MFTLNLPSVLSHVLLAYLLDKIGKDFSYWWDYTDQQDNLIRKENRSTGLDHQFKVETFVS